MPVRGAGGTLFRDPSVCGAGGRDLRETLKGGLGLRGGVQLGRALMVTDNWPKAQRMCLE